MKTYVEIRTFISIVLSWYLFFSFYFLCYFIFYYLEPFYSLNNSLLFVLTIAVKANPHRDNVTRYDSDYFTEKSPSYTSISRSYLHTYVHRHVLLTKTIPLVLLTFSINSLLRLLSYLVAPFCHFS